MKWNELYLWTLWTDNYVSNNRATHTIYKYWEWQWPKRNRIYMKFYVVYFNLAWTCPCSSRCNQESDMLSHQRWRAKNHWNSQLITSFLHRLAWCFELKKKLKSGAKQIESNLIYMSLKFSTALSIILSVILLILSLSLLIYPCIWYMNTLIVVRHLRGIQTIWLTLCCDHLT